MLPQEMSYLQNILQAEMREGQLGYKEYYDRERKPDLNLQS